MKNWAVLFASLALMSAFVEHAPAQSRPTADAVKTIGTCIAIQTNATAIETPIGLRAVGSCETAKKATRQIALSRWSPPVRISSSM
jgi:hypothetical protein